MTDILKRPPFLNRPWVSGKRYDDLRRDTVLHCDAYVIRSGEIGYLVIDWREGGRKRIALDGWTISPSGLTPVWDAQGITGERVTWKAHNASAMGALHQRVLALAREAEVSGRWARVSLQAHYVGATDTDCEPKRNAYKERTPRVIDMGKLPDIL